ncbi:DnaJ domain-containing protein [Bradyrhizobium sp.]|jgi:tetratricopeptide (TPR) repeat protein|uniref:J domain-containing protein n=1 Tax=Bradyrhizobium sp. TaxID=376 RepID=UPI003C15B5ED
METLYDLLGALPNDDADSLRAAFRQAVKGAHPDINPGDPYAALKFRKIVRASEILLDDEQRAAYDHLLDIADSERNDGSKRVADTTIYQLATGAMTLAAVSFVLLVGYMLFGYVNNLPLVAAQATDTSRAEPAKIETARIETARIEPARIEPEKIEPAKMVLAELVDAPGWTGDKVEIDGGRKFEILSSIEEAGAPSAGVSAASAASPQMDESILPARDFAARDFEPANANDYREQAISAYRNGDLYLALIKLDLAISLDPKSSDAYVDRGIVLHRLGDSKRAYADIAKAKQIDDSTRR